MGLCKCPKRKVTNLFCFEHRVNVCDHCLVESHQNCAVQSYLQWLQDSDFDVNCTLCETGLGDRETVRLPCLHLFHWDCLDSWAHRMPANTAPAGYTCPYCRDPLFPAQNQSSPMIEKLKHKLQSANWARAGLGLPLLPESEIRVSMPPPPVSKPKELPSGFVPTPPTPTHHPIYQPPPSNNYRSSTPATILDVDDIYAAQGPRVTASATDITARKKYGDTFGGSRDDVQPLLSRSEGRDVDEEQNKYKRRPILQWMGGLWRAKYGNQSTPVQRIGGLKKGIVIAFLIVVGLITLITVMSRISSGNDADPMFDPMANPNIRVAPEEHSFQ